MYERAPVHSFSKVSLVPAKIAKIVLPEAGLLQLVDMKGKGRGVVATRAIKKGKLIEKAPIIKMKKADRLSRETVLSHYPFEWPAKPCVQDFPLGFAGLLNHSDKPNCKIERDMVGETLDIYALRDIEAGEELCWNYGIDPWFEVA